MKQLTKHLVRVKFIMPSGLVHYVRHVDCANSVESKSLGREIASWLATDGGYKVDSETMTVERK